VGQEFVVYDGGTGKYWALRDEVFDAAVVRFKEKIFKDETLVGRRKGVEISL
jgi:hypothetical protein